MGEKIQSSPIYQEISLRLRALRDDLGISIEKMASDLETSPELVASYESGAVEIPVGYLHMISVQYHIDLTVLVSGRESRLQNFCVVRKGEGLQVDRRKDYDYKSLAHLFGGRKMEPFFITVPVKSKEELSFNVHTGQEFIYMLGGQLEVTIGKQVLTLLPGDSLYFDSQIPHALRALGDVPAEFIDVIQ